MSRPASPNAVLRRTLPLLLCAAVSCGILGAQRPPGTAPPPPPEVGYGPPIRVEAELVLVPVSVTDPEGRLVTGLERHHFRIFENGVEQELQHLWTEDAPISVAVIFDHSGSMKRHIGWTAQVAREFVRAAGKEDEALLVMFSDRARLAAELGSDPDAVARDMMWVQPKGTTALLDAVYLGLEELRCSRHRRRALIIFSDGMDNHSRYSQSDVERVLQEADVQVYSMGRTLEGYGLLSRLVQLTGGRSFPFDSAPNTAGLIWAELRNQYLLAYRPSHRARDGKLRKIKVRLRPPRGLPKLHVSARRGYYAPK